MIFEEEALVAVRVVLKEPEEGGSSGVDESAAFRLYERIVRPSFAAASARFLRCSSAVSTILAPNLIPK